MPELNQLLEDMIGPQRGIDPSDVRMRVGQRRRRRRRVRTTLALMSVLLVGLGAVVAVQQDGDAPQQLQVAGEGSDGGWTVLPPGPGDNRTFASVVWTGEELIVWGGEGASDTDLLNTGAAFDPIDGEWRTLPPAPIARRSGHAAVWTGEEMIVCCGGVDPMGSIAAYSPATDSWRVLEAQSELETVKYPAAVWTGERMVVVGGVAEGSQDGALQYDPAADRWQGMSELSPVTIERLPDAVWTGHEVLVVPREFTDDPPAAFNPATGMWRSLPDPPPSLAIDRPSAVWTGSDLLLWGVSRDEGSPEDYRAVGARLNTATGEWSPISDAPVGPVDWWDGTPGSNSAVWDAARSRMIVYTGAIGTGRDPDAATPVLAYYPERDAWEELPTVPTQHHHPTLTIAGERLIVSAGSFFALDLSQ